MANDAFIQLQDVPGESTAQGFEKGIEINSFSWNASAPVSVGAGTGRYVGSEGQHFLVSRHETDLTPALQSCFRRAASARTSTR